MGNFEQATEQYAYMHAKFEGLTIFRFLKLNNSSFDFLEFSTMKY
jgi:hypothetical protein